LGFKSVTIPTTHCSSAGLQLAWSDFIKIKSNVKVAKIANIRADLWIQLPRGGQPENFLMGKVVRTAYLS
jgi:hypothetical protein